MKNRSNSVPADRRYNDTATGGKEENMAKRAIETQIANQAQPSLACSVTSKPLYVSKPCMELIQKLICGIGKQDSVFLNNQIGAMIVALAPLIAALPDVVIRELLIAELMTATTPLVEAASIAIAGHIEFIDSINAINSVIRKNAGQYCIVTPGRRINEFKKPIRASKSKKKPTPAEESIHLRPWLVVPADYPMLSCALGICILRAFDVAMKFGGLSDEDAIEERVRACHLAMCWFLACLDNEAKIKRTKEVIGLFSSYVRDVIALTPPSSLIKDRGYDNQMEVGRNFTWAPLNWDGKAYATIVSLP
jgi:hypothetical protein